MGSSCSTAGQSLTKRRAFLRSGSALALSLASMSAWPASVVRKPVGTINENNSASFHKSKDGTMIYFKDWGAGPPIVFSHGWPLDADAWDPQMFFFASQGYRVIAHDRRGHGRSMQPWLGNDMDTYADDLAGLLDALDVKQAMLVGHSTGGGEVSHYVGRHGTGRVSKIALIGAVPPVMLKSDKNPGGMPIAEFDKIRLGTLDRANFYKDLAIPFYGYNRARAHREQGIIDEFWR